MRQDQYEKLQVLADKLLDVFIHEADPDSWPGAGIAPNAMDKATRGDRVWCKKDAAGTAVLIMKSFSMTGMSQNASGGGVGGLAAVPAQAAAPDSGPAEDGDMDTNIAAFEKEANVVLARVQKRLGKRE